MLNKKLFLICLSCFIYSNTLAAKTIDKPYYLKFEGGASYPQSKLNYSTHINKKHSRGDVYGLGVGYKFSDTYRTDISLSHRSNYKFSDYRKNINRTQKFKNTSLFANLYYDINSLSSKITPFFNAGIALSENRSSLYQCISGGEVNAFAKKTKNYNLGWNIGLGTDFNISKTLKAGVFLRYLDLGKYKEAEYIHEDPSDNFKLSPGKLRTLECGAAIKIIF